RIDDASVRAVWSEDIRHGAVTTLNAVTLIAILIDEVRRPTNGVGARIELEVALRSPFRQRRQRGALVQVTDTIEALFDDDAVANERLGFVLVNPGAVGTDDHRARTHVERVIHRDVDARVLQTCAVDRLDV